MKKIKLALLALSVSAASFSTLAAESAVINVKGSVAPVACSLDVNGSADYGTRSVTDLKLAGKQAEGYQLGIKSVPFTIQCNSSAVTSLKVVADELGAGATSPVKINSPSGSTATVTLSDAAYAPLKDGEAVLGYYAVGLGDFEVDGKPANRLDSADGKTWTALANKVAIAQDGHAMHSWSTDGELTPAAAETVTGIVAISAALIPDAVEGIKDTVSFNTNTTLQLTYL